MGTFHQGKSELHGITVVVETTDGEVLVGRCDDVVGGQVILLDAAGHRDGDSGQSREEWLRRAARFGVFKQHDRLLVASDRVTAIRRLGELSE